MKEKSMSNLVLWKILANFCIKGIGFFTAPIFTRLLLPSDYGQLATYTAWVLLISTFIGLQTHQSIPLARIKYEKVEIYSYLSSVFFISFISSIVFFLIMFFGKNFFGRILGFPSFLIPIIAINSFFSYAISFYMYELIQFKKIEMQAIISFMQVLASSLLALLLVFLHQHNKYLYKILAENIVTILLGTIFILIIFIRGKCIFNKTYWKFCLSYTAPLIFHGASSILLAQSDRVMLKSMCGESEAGIYSVAVNFAFIINVIFSSFDAIWLPFYFDYKKANRSHEIILRSKNYRFTFTVLTIGFLLLSPEVFKIFAPQQYWNAIRIILIIVAGYYADFLYSFTTTYNFYYQRTKLISVGTFFAACINIALNMFFIRKMQGYGAAFATMLSYVILFLVNEFTVRIILKAKNIDLNFSFYVKGVIPVVCVLFFMLLAEYKFIIGRWTVAFVLGIMLLIRIKNQKGIL